MEHAELFPPEKGHIGTDESGKGDYFGPIVIAGVLSAVSLAYSPGVASEGLNVARGVATFTLPFIRSRHATAADSMRIHLG